MRNKKFLIVLFFLIIIPISYSLDGYTLVINETFNSASITSTAGTWSITNTSCKNKNCLSGSGVSGGAFGYVNNNTFFLNHSLTKNRYFIRGWLKDNTGAGVNGWCGLGWDYTGSYTAGNIDIVVVSDRENGHYYMYKEGISSLIALNDTASTGDAWNYFEMNFTSWNVTSIFIWNGTDKGKLVVGQTKAYSPTSHDGGYFGFICHAQCMWDDVEIYMLGEAPPVTNTVVINSNMTSINGSFTSQNISYNGTFTGTAGASLYDCYLRNFTTVINTSISVNLTNKNYFVRDFTGIEGGYNFSIKCNESTGINGTTAYFIYNVDNVNPIILSSMVNNTFYYVNSNVTIYSNYSDLNLLAYNVTLRNGSQNVVLNRFLNNIATPTAENTTLYLANYTGNFSVKFEAWDSHTRLFIPDYNWESYQVIYNDKVYRGIRFNDNYLNLSTDDFSKLSGFALVKRQDRYIMGFNFTQVNFTFSLFLGSKQNITYLPTSEYDGHFVIGNKHWVDFESDDVTNVQVNYVASADVWRIRFVPKSNIVVFKSIGDLNYAERTYYFNVTPAVPVNSSALQWNGVVFWALNDDYNGTNMSVWSATQGFGSVQSTTMSGGANGITYWLVSDYSRIKDLGLVCQNTINGQVWLYFVNTTTGSILNSTMLYDSNMYAYESCMVYNVNQTNMFDVFYDNLELDNTDNRTHHRRYNGTGSSSNQYKIEEENTIYYEHNPFAEGDTRVMYVKKNPVNPDEYVISTSDGGSSDAYRMAIYNADLKRQLFAWTSDSTFIVGDQINRYGRQIASAYTGDGNYVISIFANISTTALNTSQNYYMVWNRSNNMTTTPATYSHGATGFIGYVHGCTMRGINNKVFFIYTTNGSSAYTHVMNINGSIETITVDPSVEFNKYQKDNVECYEDWDNGKIWGFFVDNDKNGLDYFFYNYTDSTFHNTTSVITSLESATYSGDVAGNDIHLFEAKPCPSGSCLMFSMSDSDVDAMVGVYFNGTGFYTEKAVEIETNAFNYPTKTFLFGKVDNSVCNYQGFGDWVIQNQVCNKNTLNTKIQSGYKLYLINGTLELVNSYLNLGGSNFSSTSKLNMSGTSYLKYE